MRAVGSYLILLALVASGCETGPRKYRVVGAVSWQGVPVEEGSINFLPEDGNVHAVTAKIVNGRYDARVPAGRMRVEIFADKDLGYSEAMHQNVKTRLIPAEYNSLSILTAEIQANDENTADFPLPHKK